MNVFLLLYLVTQVDKGILQGISVTHDQLHLLIAHRLAFFC